MRGRHIAGQMHTLLIRLQKNSILFVGFPVKEIEKVLMTLLDIQRSFAADQTFERPLSPSWPPIQSMLRCGSRSCISNNFICLAHACKWQCEQAQSGPIALVSLYLLVPLCSHASCPYYPPPEFSAALRRVASMKDRHRVLSARKLRGFCETFFRDKVTSHDE